MFFQLGLRTRFQAQLESHHVAKSLRLLRIIYLALWGHGMPRIPTMLRRILRFGFDFLRALSMRLIASLL